MRVIEQLRASLFYIINYVFFGLNSSTSCDYNCRKGSGDQAKNFNLLYTRAVLFKEPPTTTSVISATYLIEIMNQDTLSLAFNSARFLQSGSKLSNCPPETMAEICFAGRSNAGKSSAINALTNNKKLARTSKTPGRTQLINFFSLNDPRVRLVDLPGYGYAKVSLDLKAQWGKHLDAYLQNRACLSTLVLIMDIRKPLTEFDWMLLDWSHRCALPTLVLLTKADKLKRGAAKNAYFQVKKELEEHASLTDIILFSSLNKDGVKEARASLNKITELAQSAQSFDQDQDQNKEATSEADHDLADQAPLDQPHDPTQDQHEQE